VVNAESSIHVACAGRGYYNDNALPSDDLAIIRRILATPYSLDYFFILGSSPTMFYTPYSFAGVCSRHWLPQEAALAGCAENELRALSAAMDYFPTETGGAVALFRKKW
jgi:hypothetical protein